MAEVLEKIGTGRVAGAMNIGQLSLGLFSLGMIFSLMLMFGQYQIEQQRSETQSEQSINSRLSEIHAQLAKLTDSVAVQSAELVRVTQHTEIRLSRLEGQWDSLEVQVDNLKEMLTNPRARPDSWSRTDDEAAMRALKEWVGLSFQRRE